MSRAHSILVWLHRLFHSRGFGIQSPTDYAFVRYVINEHWPYYAYETLTDDDWLTQKLGHLYLRLANWRQPTVMVADRYQPYWQAGCRSLQFVDSMQQVVERVGRVELARIDADTDMEQLLSSCDKQSVVVLEDICRHRQWWEKVLQDERVGTTFDLYYCGILFFDNNRFKHHYKINF